RATDSSSSRVLRKYLKGVADRNRGLNPKGFAQQSQVLLSVNVPLDDVYIHLSAVPDRPLYDMPHEQLKLLEVLRQEADMEPAERERRIQDLRRIWASLELAEIGQRREASIEEVLQRLTVANPVAVILGAQAQAKVRPSAGLPCTWPRRLSYRGTAAGGSRHCICLPLFLSFAVPQTKMIIGMSLSYTYRPSGQTYSHLGWLPSKSLSYYVSASMQVD
ncbi:MAG: hypothetical protein JO123_07425, partial [Ktedonobacteraceae bacterium]|nr:hypothetical protein [Ktedonobacteraceae bacterium]